MLGLDRGSNVSWSNALTIISCIASIPIFAIFLVVEMKVASHPFAPGHIIFDRSLFASYLVNFLTIGSYMGMIFYLPLVFQVVQGLSATGAGLRLIPPLIFSVSGSLFGGKVIQQTGKYNLLTKGTIAISLIGLFIVFLSSGLVFNLPLGLIVGFCLASFGGGSTITTTLISVIANADPKDQAVATACTYLFRSLGSVVGVSLSATIVQQTLRTQLRENLKSREEADKIVDRVRQNLDYIKELDPLTKEIVKGCYQKATSASFGLGIAFVSAALVASFWMKEKKLSK
jgi:predicted MFS family arabinose efflux permease